MAFVNSVTQCMPGFGSGGNYGYATSAAGASTNTLTIAATTTTPSTGGIPFNQNGGPAPSRGKVRVRVSGLGGATTAAIVITVTDGTTIYQVGQVPTTAASSLVDETFEFTTDLSITSTSAVFTLGGSTATCEMEISMN
jgi:hypothetical protein